MAIKFLNTVQVDTDILYVGAAGDNVGIGTNNPNTANKLQVDGQLRVLGAQVIGNSNVANVAPTGVQLHLKNSGAAALRLEDSDSANLAFDLNVNEGSGFSIIETTGGDAGDDTRLFIEETSGNVGIGTTSPTSYGATANTLEVRGASGTGSGLIRVSNAGNTVGSAFYSGSSSSTLGTQTAHPLYLSTNNSAKMTILSGGNVGIGTTNPSQKLTIRDDSANVYSTGDAGTNTGDLVLQNNDETDDNFNRISFQSNSGNNQTGDLLDAARITAIYPDHVGGNPSGELAFETKADAGSMAEAMRIDRDGNVGIGTDNPNDILDIHKANSQLRLTDSDDNKFVQFSYSGGKLITRNNSTDTAINQTTLTEDGKFGIGTTSPTADLHIQGSSAADLPILRVGGFGDSGSKLELAEALASGNMTHGYSFFNDGTSSNTLIIKAHNNSTTGVTAMTISRSSAVTTFGPVPVVGTRTAGDSTARAASTAFVTSAIAAAPQGDITAVIAGTGLTGGGTSGSVTLNVASGTYTPYNDIRSLGTTYFTNGANPNITTAQVMAEIEADGGFDSYSSVFKTSWSYAGNYNLTDAGDFTETAGSSWITWTDNSSDTTRGNITALAIAPNTGGSAGGVFIYNDQGSSYSPGWRQVWTNTTDGAGSGLDADLLDGQQGSYYATAASLGNYLPLAGGNMTGDIQMSANSVKFDQSGTRSWDISPGSGNLNITSGDSGGLVFLSPGISVEDNAFIGGGLTVNGGDIDIQDNDILIDTSHGFINSGAWTRNATPHGYIEFGPANTTWAHIYTDRPNFYFNKELYVNNSKVWNAGNDGSGSGLDADKLDGVHKPTNFSATSQTYTTIATGQWDLPTGSSVFSKSNSAGGPGAVGYWYVTGRRDVSGGYGGIYSSYSSGQHWFGYNSTGTANPTWDKIWTDKTFTPGNYLPLSGGTMSGAISFGSSNANINLSRSSFITFYEDSSSQHAIGSRNSSGVESDDIRINSYGAVYINLDSNNNNNSNADFVIGKHGGGTGTISQFFKVSGESGNVGIGTTSPDTKLHVEGNVLIDAYNQGEDNGLFFREGFLTIDQPSITVWDMSNGGASPDGLSINAQDGIRFRENGGEVARFKDGNVGIGTTNPQAKLHVSGGSSIETTLIVGAEGNGNDKSARVFLNEGEGGVYNSKDYGFSLAYDGQGSQYAGLAANQFGILRHNNSAAGGAVMVMNRTNNNTTFTGTVTGTNFILSSDERLKKNIEEVDNKSIKADWKTFELKTEKGQKRYGVIAQELEKNNPEFVREDSQGFKSVAYIDLLIAKIAELEARLEKLEK